MYSYDTPFPIATPGPHFRMLSDRRHTIQIIGLLAGPLLALLAYQSLPVQFIGSDGNVVEFTTAGRATLAVMVWMATWWLTEAIDISATALLPIVLFPVLGILPIGRATAPYGSDLIFLFMGGFILALSMQRWGLDKRIALHALRLVGTKPPNMIGGFMFVTALLSMWVSNTATAAMMLPIALSVVDLVLNKTAAESAAGGIPAAMDTGRRNFALSLMLGIAYAASIGGIATIIGSPPNGILVQFMQLEYSRDISFLDWMMIGGPVALVFLPLAWVIITWVLYPIGISNIEGGQQLIRSELKELGPMKRGEWVTMAVFFCAVAGWIFRPLLASVALGSGEDALRPFAGLSDAGIAMTAAMVLFVIPVKSRELTFTMDWPTAARLPWGILILFGGGLSLAAGVQATGVAEFLGTQATALRGYPSIVLVLAVTTGVIFLTELTSNTATTATLVPILAALAPGMGIAPEMVIIPTTIAASCAFMLPVATPPNAIVFGSGYVTIPEMAKAGLWLNFAGIIIITAVMYMIVLPLLGISMAASP